MSLQDFGIKVTSDNTLVLTKDAILALLKLAGAEIPTNCEMYIPLVFGEGLPFEKDLSVKIEGSAGLRINWKEETTNAS